MVTREEYWALKAFKRDDAEDKMVNSSEIFNAYRAIEAKREQDMAKMAVEKTVADKEAALQAFEEFEKKVASNPALKAKLRQIKQALDSDPELVSKTDSNFVNGIYMLDLGE